MRAYSLPECEKRHYNPVGESHRRSPPVSISGTGSGEYLIPSWCTELMSWEKDELGTERLRTIGDMPRVRIELSTLCTLFTPTMRIRDHQTRGENTHHCAQHPCSLRYIPRDVPPSIRSFISSPYTPGRICARRAYELSHLWGLGGPWEALTHGFLPIWAWWLCHSACAALPACRPWVDQHEVDPGRQAGVYMPG